LVSVSRRCAPRDACMHESHRRRKSLWTLVTCDTETTFFYLGACGGLSLFRSNDSNNWTGTPGGRRTGRLERRPSVFDVTPLTVAFVICWYSYGSFALASSTASTVVATSPRINTSSTIFMVPSCIISCRSLLTKGDTSKERYICPSSILPACGSQSKNVTSSDLSVLAMSSERNPDRISNIQISQSAYRSG
jgi:hypothetical protein